MSKVLIIGAGAAGMYAAVAAGRAIRSMYTKKMTRLAESSSSPERDAAI